MRPSQTKLREAFLGIAIAWVVPVERSHASELPQKHAYQQTLREFLADLTVSDFEIALSPIGFRDTWLPADDDLYQMWILCQRMPHAHGIAISPECFTLEAIESDQGIRMRAGGRGGFHLPGLAVDPQDLCWWATWKYRGNPYYDSLALRRRAFVIAAVDMIMLDNLHESGTHWVENARRSDYLSGTLVWLTYVYWKTKQDLPEVVRGAYEEGLFKLFGRLAEWGPTRVNDNMDTCGLVAAAYLEKAVNDHGAVAAARAYANRVLDVFHPCGMVRDAGGLEASYNGIALFNLAWAAAISEWPEVLEMQHSTAVLKGMLTLPEPDGRVFWGPSHFSTRTGADSANDQWGVPHRDLAIAMREPSATYLAFSGRNQRPAAWGVPTPQQMSRDISLALDKLNQKAWQPSEEVFPEWAATWWGSGRFNYAYEHYQPGFYAKLRAIQRAGDLKIQPPIIQPAASGVTVFPKPAKQPDDLDRDAFAEARYPDYSAVIYTGPLGRHGYMNFCGGALSAFWTPTAGAVILGRSGKPVPMEGNPQTWANWRLWPTHAVSGETLSGDAFSSARVRRRVSTIRYERRDDGLVAHIAAPLGQGHDKSHAAQNGCLKGDVHYFRRIAMGSRGVAVQSGLNGDGKDSVVELCEILPLALFDPRVQMLRLKDGREQMPHHRIMFQMENGVLADASRDYTENVKAVLVERFSGKVRIQFANPQRVRVGEVWQDDYQTRMQVRNLIIDLLAGKQKPAMLGKASVSYLISAD